MPSPTSWREMGSGVSPPPPPSTPPTLLSPRPHQPLLLLPPPLPPSSSPPPQQHSLPLLSPPPAIPEIDMGTDFAAGPVLYLPGKQSERGEKLEHRYRPELSYTPPHTTPLGSRPFRYSDHIHRDRHIFLKGASLGIGVGTAEGSLVTGEGNGLPLQPDHSGFTIWTSDRGGINPQSCFVDEHGIVFYRDQGVRLGSTMPLGQEHLPALHRGKLVMTASADSRKAGGGGGTAGGYPILAVEQRSRPSQHQQPKPSSSLQTSRLSSRRTRPFNELLNTYVDTQKRIRAVQCADDLYRQSPRPALPFLSTPASDSSSSLAVPRQGRPPPRPARVMIHVPRVTEPQPYSPPVPPSRSNLSRHASFIGTGKQVSDDATPVLKSSASPRSQTREESLVLGPAATNSDQRGTTFQHVAKPLGGTGTLAVGRGNTRSVREFTFAGVPLLHSSQAESSSFKPKFGDQQLVSELLIARKILQNPSQHASADRRPAQAVTSSGSRDYVNYFLARDGVQGGTFGRLFESYPKRELMVHPGRFQRQRTDIVARSKLKQLLQ